MAKAPATVPHNVNHPPAGYFVSGRVIFGALCGGGYILPFNRVLAKPWGYGRFSLPLRNSKTVSLYHSTDDTPSASHSLSSSLREGAGDGCTIQRTARNPEGYGRFSSPLRNSKTVSLYHSSGDTPSVSFADSSLREGAGNGLYHSTCRSETATLRAIFIAPTEAQKILHSTAHRGAAMGGA